MKKETTVRYIANDGKEFSDEQECKDYEILLGTTDNDVKLFTAKDDEFILYQQEYPHLYRWWDELR